MTDEQRARDDAIVLAALPGTKNKLWQALNEQYPNYPFGRVDQTLSMTLRRLKRAGKARFNGKVWEAVR